MAAKTTAAGGPLMGEAGTTTVQTTLMPPAEVAFVLKGRYDATTGEGSWGITVKDATNGDEMAMVATPFHHYEFPRQMTAAAVARLLELLEAVLDPDPF